MKKIAKALMKHPKREDNLDAPRENPNLVEQDESQQAIVLQQQKEKHWLDRFSPEEQKLIRRIAIGLGISVVAAILFFLSRRFVRKKIKHKVEDKSLGNDKHATWAKQIKNAFDNNGWWGTDEVLLRNTLRAIPSQQDFKRVSNAYKGLSKGRSLVADMTSELKITEYNEMLAIIEAKPKMIKDVVPGKPILDPKGWAKRINAALSYQWIGLFWGTDVDAIKAVYMEIPSIKAYKNMKYHYWKMFGAKLLKDLDGDWVDGYALYRKYIKKKPYSIYANAKK